ncbi:MAG: HDIG domain-containing protein [Candidatus Tectomicrobia bacterium]|uniref:HDIG domain-containing protein n=1 Tax=Tectimicrobiota bacterium TaxID=2528274 RepID=A0A932FW05_UNCTE|nr:HDIG domain-containing protein [Candidatus Tectomicrobia bacterium]
MLNQKDKIDAKIRERPFTIRFYKLRARWLLGITAVVSLIFFSFFDRIFSPIDYPQVGESAPKTLRAPYDFFFDEKEAGERAAREELEHFVPLFIRRPNVQKAIAEKVQALMQEIQEVQGDHRLSEARRLERLRALFPRARKRELKSLLGYKQIDGLKEVILSELLTPILDKGILASKGLLAKKRELRVHEVSGSPSQRVPVEEVYSLEEARQSLHARAERLFFPLDEAMVDLLIHRIAGYLSPNLFYSVENAREIQEITRASSKRLVYYQRGDILLKRGDPVTQMDLLRLEACNAQRGQPYWAAVLGSFIPFLILTLLFIVYLSHFHPQTFSNLQNYAFVFLAILILLIFAKVLLLFTPFSVYLIPVPMMGMLVASLMNKRVALITTLLAAAYVTFMANFRMPLFLFYAIGGIVGIWAGMKSHKRGALFLFSLGMGAVNVLILLCGRAIENSLALDRVHLHLGMEAFAGAILSWLLTLLVTPFFEKIFDMASTYRLLELSDPNSPLLKKLMEKAPGTYYHSLAVGNLAAAAADAVGANSLLVRVGAYYHDIGKALRPQYFVENQIGGGENPHDALTPAMSAHILRSHVREGVEVGKRYDLPQRILDLIPEHHGTAVMSFFYHKAQNGSEKTPNGSEKWPAEEFFRYEGPRPRTVEAAILMIADSAEAVFRTLKNPTYSRVEEVVKEVVRAKFNDGQFDDCQITMKELSRAIGAITNCIVSSSHQRIEYPKAEEKVKVESQVA